MADEMSLGDAANVLRQFSRTFAAATRLGDACTAAIRARDDLRDTQRLLTQAQQDHEATKTALAAAKESLGDLQNHIRSATSQLDGVRGELGLATKQKEEAVRGIEQATKVAQAEHAKALDRLANERRIVEESLALAKVQLAKWHADLEAAHR